MSHCTAPGCIKPPVLQWQREASQLEADHAVDRSQDTQAQLHKHNVTHATVHLIQTRRQHADALDAAKAGDHRARAILDTLAEGIGDAETALEQLEQAGPDVIPAPDSVTVAVFACDTHAVTADAATWLHQVGCLTDPPGQCTCPAPAQE